MSNRIVAFKDESGNKVEYEILDQLLVNRREYLIMSPPSNHSDIDVYQLTFNKGHEELLLVENETEINMVKSVSHKI